MEKSKFQHLLRQQDWYYEFSDDYKVYCRGRDSMRLIESLIEQQPELREIYHDYVKKLNEGR